MGDDRAPIVFNRYTRPGPARGAAQGGAPAPVFLYSDAPVVQLSPIDGARRPRSAAQRMPRRAAPEGVFGDALGWGLRGFIVHVLGGDAADGQRALGTLPEQAVTARAKRRELRDVQLVPADAPGGKRLCLFNVVVALEWTPSAHDVQQLMWAFQRASDLLYDVTDGSMAFGQVVLGGRELMGCAAFQIMASNRLHPRSYTNGLHDPRKYVPIRIGRGLWQKDLRSTTAWEEPEGYRVLVHEWGHYALSLKDEYLDLAHVARDAHDETLLVDADRAGGDGAAVLVVPGISLPVESIMSRISSSELMAQKETRGGVRKANEWAKLAEKAEFTFLGIAADHRPVAGPMRLPLPLPSVQLWGGLERAAQRSEDVALRLPLGRIQPDHCWVYVVKGGLARPRQLIAQGTAEARAASDGFALLGAAEDDTVVLIGLVPADGEAVSAPVVLHARLGDVRHREDGAEASDAAWTDATPTVFPFVDVIPVLDAGGASESHEVERFTPKRVRVEVTPSAPGATYRRARQWLFPLGGEGGVAVRGEPVDVPALDGHVLVSIDGGRQFTISTYSQGGGPGATPPVHANPTTAGSSEGNVMLFFYDEEFGPAFGPDAMPYDELATVGRDPSTLSVVTTLNHGIVAPPGTLPRSYTFSLAATEPLPELHPTLVMFYDRDTAAEAGAPRVYRYGAEGWQPAATYVPAGLPYVAAPLDRESAPGLVSGESVERYRMCLR